MLLWYYKKMRTITKKIWPEYFEAVASGKKTFELRLNDFDVAVGDTLILQEWDPETKHQTGRTIKKKVPYVAKFTLEKLSQFWPKEDIAEKGIQIISLEQISSAQKDFDAWNIEKKRVHQRTSEVYAYQREIWWCALGVNIGAETDGKNNNFERPVLVLRVYNKDTLLVLPITSKEKKDRYHCGVRVSFGRVWIKLTQVRVISNRRLLRKLGVLPLREFKKVQQRSRKYL